MLMMSQFQVHKTLLSVAGPLDTLSVHLVLTRRLEIFFPEDLKRRLVTYVAIEKVDTVFQISEMMTNLPIRISSSETAVL